MVNAALIAAFDEEMFLIYHEFKDKFYGIVDSHLTEVSRAFPAAIFLLEHFDTQASYSGKRVMRDGEIVR
jgi:hypothetical protein